MTFRVKIRYKANGHTAYISIVVPSVSVFAAIDLVTKSYNIEEVVSAAATIVNP